MQSTSIASHRSDEAQKSLSEKLSATQPSPAGQQEFMGYKSLFSFLWSSLTHLENEILLLAKLPPNLWVPFNLQQCPSQDPWFFWQLHMHEPNFPEFLRFGSVGNFDDELLVSKVLRKVYSAAIPACLYMKFCIYERPGTFLVELRTLYPYPCQLNYTKKKGVAERMLHTSDKYHGAL